jgi:hypothetical protein
MHDFLNAMFTSHFMTRRAEMFIGKRNIIKPPMAVCRRSCGSTGLLQGSQAGHQLA